MKPSHSLARLAGLALLAAAPAFAADHLDTPTVIADPAADIGDLFAWTAADGKRLNLVMNIVGKHLSDQVQYVFHVDSGYALGRTTASTRLVCQFATPGAASCWAGRGERLQGDASSADGLLGKSEHIRVFAGSARRPVLQQRTWHAQCTERCR